MRSGSFSIHCWAPVAVLAFTEAFVLIHPHALRRGLLPHPVASVPRGTRMPKLWLYEQNGDIEEMRRLLEMSWNAGSMGQVPTNAEDAAEAAMSSLTEAIRSPSSKSKIYAIDILIPQYNIQQGSKVYDEVLAVEFCIQLAKKMEGRTQIILRDDNILRTVQRVLSARKEQQPPDDDIGKQYDNEASMSIEHSESFDDLSDSKPQFSSANIESFRQQLIDGWRKDDGTDGPKAENTIESLETLKQRPAISQVYRITSMLGSETIKTLGPDRNSQILKAVAENAKPEEDEDTVIILSACSSEEMIATRSLVSHYGDRKTFLLINCNLEPTPRELYFAETVYSIQPFIARPSQGSGNENSPQPKVVVMRRFPSDWQIFVDVDGEGFVLASEIAAGRVGKKGPSMQMIADCVKAHLESRKAR